VQLNIRVRGGTPSADVVSVVRRVKADQVR
jgi:hypothetical protein